MQLKRASFGSAEASPHVSVREMEQAKEVGPRNDEDARYEPLGLLGERSGGGPGVERVQDGRDSL